MANTPKKATTKESNSKASPKKKTTPKTVKSKKTSTPTKTPATKTTKASSSAKSIKKDINQVEKRLDTAMKNVSKKITPEAKKKAQALLGKADEVANKVDDFVDQVDDFADNFLPHGIGSTATFQAEWAPTVSRLFIFRFLWIIIQYFVIIVWGIWIQLLTVIHVLYMLIFGKRERNLWNRQIRFSNHIVKWEAYILGLTDERPDMITPESK